MKMNKNGKIVLSCSNRDVLLAITGQEPIATITQKSIVNFGIRKGSEAGFIVTLRKSKMHNFLARFLNLAVPSQRDFRGLPTINSKIWNYGIKDVRIFPEIRQRKQFEDLKQGLNISFVNLSHEKTTKIITN